MKVLVGVACVAVIAFVGYFFWGEWQQADAPRQAELAFLHECHRDVGEVRKRLKTSLMVSRDHPELSDRIVACENTYGSGWGDTEDANLLAFQAEGAARTD